MLDSRGPRTTRRGPFHRAMPPRPTSIEFQGLRPHSANSCAHSFSHTHTTHVTMRACWQASCGSATCPRMIMPYGHDMWTHTHIPCVYVHLANNACMDKNASCIAFSTAGPPGWRLLPPPPSHSRQDNFYGPNKELTSITLFGFVSTSAGFLSPHIFLISLPLRRTAGWTHSSRTPMCHILPRPIRPTTTFAAELSTCNLRLSLHPKSSSAACDPRASAARLT